MRKVRAMADNPVSKVCAIVDYLFANECENVKMAREERGMHLPTKMLTSHEFQARPRGRSLSYRRQNS